MLKVGPESAGADPGPACYGRGGEEPTVTDADLILGYLDPDFFLGGRMSLDREAASRGDRTEDRSAALDLDPIEAAWGIHQVVNENMANAARVHAVERGKDPRKYPLFAFGGAGPVHAYRVALALGVPGFVAPLGAGATSAFGFLCAPLSFDFARSLYGRLDDLDWSEVNAGAGGDGGGGTRSAARLWGHGRRRSRCAGSARCDTSGQGHEVAVELPEGNLGPDDAAEIWGRATGKEYRTALQSGRPRRAAGDADLAPRGRRSAARDPARSGEESPRALSEAQKGRARDLPARARGLPERYRSTIATASDPAPPSRDRRSWRRGSLQLFSVQSAEAEIDAARNLIVRW